MEVFTQFSSELDKSTKDLLEHGHRLVELLKQPLYKPFSMPDEVIMLCVAQHKLMMDVPVKDISKFRYDLLDYFHANYSNLIQKIDAERILSNEIENEILKATKEFKAGR